jgi:hypothetical protein
MKKYVITESQLKTIVEKYDQIPKEVIKSKPMTFQNFINAIKMEKNGGETDKGDLKSFVSAKMAGDRAKNYLNKTDDALDKIAGGEGSIKGYSLVNDDPVLADAEDLSIIMLSLLYYFYKEGKLPRFKITDVQMEFEKNYEIIKRRGLDDFKVLLRAKFTSDWSVSEMPDNEDEALISTPTGSIQVHANILGGMATLVKFNFIDSATLNKFYGDVIKNNDIMNKVKKALNKNFIPSLESGSLIFKF